MSPLYDSRCPCPTHVFLSPMHRLNHFFLNTGQDYHLHNIMTAKPNNNMPHVRRHNISEPVSWREIWQDSQRLMPLTDMVWPNKDNDNKKTQKVKSRMDKLMCDIAKKMTWHSLKAQKSRYGNDTKRLWIVLDIAMKQSFRTWAMYQCGIKYGLTKMIWIVLWKFRIWQCVMLRPKKV